MTKKILIPEIGVLSGWGGSYAIQLHGEIVPAGGTTIEGCFHLPDLGLWTTRAARPVWPTKRLQIGAARSFIVEAIVEFQHSLRVIGHPDYYNRLGLGESSA